MFFECFMLYMIYIMVISKSNIVLCPGGLSLFTCQGDLRCLQRRTKDLTWFH